MQYAMLVGSKTTTPSILRGVPGRRLLEPRHRRGAIQLVPPHLGAAAAAAARRLPRRA
jgi:hypothetical protein